jgi:hypothetical protein
VAIAIKIPRLKIKFEKKNPHAMAKIINNP